MVCVYLPVHPRIHIEATEVLLCSMFFSANFSLVPDRFCSLPAKAQEMASVRRIWHNLQVARGDVSHPSQKGKGIALAFSKAAQFTGVPASTRVEQDSKRYERPPSLHWPFDELFSAGLIREVSFRAPFGFGEPTGDQAFWGSSPDKNLHGHQKSFPVGPEVGH